MEIYTTLNFTAMCPIVLSNKNRPVNGRANIYGRKVWHKMLGKRDVPQ
jgi:hypothetical protein